MIWLSCKADASSVSGLDYGRTIAATHSALTRQYMYKETSTLRSTLTSGVIQCITELVGLEPTHNRIKTDCLTIWQ